MAKAKAVKRVHKRNGALFDKWSIVHFCTGILFGWFLHPVLALALMILWEPIEIFVLSPILAKRGIVFGYESLNNSLSDIVFDALGIAVGAWTVSVVALHGYHIL